MVSVGTLFPWKEYLCVFCLALIFASVLEKLNPLVIKFLNRSFSFTKLIDLQTFKHSKLLKAPNSDANSR